MICILGLKHSECYLRPSCLQCPGHAMTHATNAAWSSNPSVILLILNIDIDDDDDDDADDDDADDDDRDDDRDENEE